MSASSEARPAARVEVELVAKLRSGYGSERLEAVQELRGALGPRALEPLCEALRDPKLKVRVAAAVELGALEDPRAVTALRQALRDRLSGGTASTHVGRSFQLVATWFCLWIIVSVYMVLTYSTWVGVAVALFLGFFTLPGKYLTWERSESRFVEAVSMALARIAEKQVTPEVYRLTPELRILAADWLQQDAAARELIRKAAERIEEATERYRDLPLASAPAPIVGDVQLPRVSEAPVEAGRLPVVRQED